MIFTHLCPHPVLHQNTHTYPQIPPKILRSHMRNRTTALSGPISLPRRNLFIHVWEHPHHFDIVSSKVLLNRGNTRHPQVRQAASQFRSASSSTLVSVVLVEIPRSKANPETVARRKTKKQPAPTASRPLRRPPLTSTQGPNSFYGLVQGLSTCNRPSRISSRNSSPTASLRGDLYHSHSNARQFCHLAGASTHFTSHLLFHFTQRRASQIPRGQVISFSSRQRHHKSRLQCLHPFHAVSLEQPRDPVFLPFKKRTQCFFFLRVDSSSKHSCLRFVLTLLLGQALTSRPYRYRSFFF
jgi:hypothetical protein